MQFIEREIQDFIWKNRDNWHELIDEVEYPALISFEGEDGLERVNAESLLHNYLVSKISDIHAQIKHLFLIGVEVSLGNQGTSKIRADFLATREGNTGIFIIELKKSKQTEREAFTELLAYANHLNYLFPSHCVDDTVLVLIAPINTRTVEAAFLQSLLFDRKQVCILQPYLLRETDLNSLKLRPFVPKSEDMRLFFNAAFSKRNFDVEVVVWSDVPSFWNPHGKDSDEYVKKQMNRVAGMAAQLMEAKNIHGFVYGQQSWPELMGVAYAYPNKLVMAAINPYKIANDYYYLTKYPEISHDEIPNINDWSDDAVNLTDIIPGLKSPRSSVAHDDWNYFSGLGSVWGSHLWRIGRTVVEFANTNRLNENIHIELASGGSWDVYEVNSIENIYTFNYEVRTTGLLRELYTETTKLDYEYWSKYDKHPYQGDSFGWALENAESHWSFEVFLNRMFYGSNGNVDDDEDSEQDIISE